MNADDPTLNAYLDGELAGAKLKAFEARLFRDPALMRTVRELRAQDELLREAFSLNTPARTAVAQEPSRRRAWRSTFRPLPLAASLAALTLGVLIGMTANLDRDAGESVGGYARRDASLQRALEHELSGVAAPWSDAATGARGEVIPVATYRNASGQFCREFEEHHVHGSTSRVEGGVACRGPDGVWRVRMRYFP